MVEIANAAPFGEQFRIEDSAVVAEDRVILLVEPTLSQRYLLRALFESRGFHVVSAKTAAEADTKIRAVAISLALVSWELPDASAFRTIARWRRDPDIRACSVFMMDARRDLYRAFRAREAGAIDLVERPCSTAAMESFIERVGPGRLMADESGDSQSRSMSPRFIVPANDRIILMRRIRSELEDLRVSGRPLTLCLLSLENLTDIKIEHGRALAERIMTAMERHLWLRVRACDLVARHTGSEFALLLPYTDRSGADIVLERISDSIGSRSWGRGDIECALGATTGAATAENGDSSPIDLVRASVAALGLRDPDLRSELGS